MNPDDYAVNVTAMVLQAKNLEIVELQAKVAELGGVCGHQQKLLNFVHEEKQAQIKKIDSLLTQAAQDSCKLADNHETIRKLQIENAALKRQLEAGKDETAKQERVLRGKLMFSEFKSSKLEKENGLLKQDIADAQAKLSSVEMRPVVCQSDAGTQTKTGYVLFAAERTNAIQASRLKEIRAVQRSLKDWEGFLEDVEDVFHYIDEIREQKDELENELCLEKIKHEEAHFDFSTMFAPVMEATEPSVEAVLTILEAETIEVAPEAVVAQKAKKANKKKKAPKETPEERVAKQQMEAAQAEAKLKAELEAHKEAARAIRERERVAKAEKKADLLARVHTTRAEETQAAPVQAKKAQTTRDLPMSAGMLRVEKVNAVTVSTAETAKTFAMRSDDVRDLLFTKEVSAILSLYVLECFGQSSWKLEEADEKFRLVLRREFPDTGKVISKASPYVSGKDIVFWVERPEFVTTMHAVFEFKPLLVDEHTTDTINNAFERIRANHALKTLRLRVSARKDAFGLSMRQITLKDKSTMTFSLVKLIIWFYMGKIEAMAGTVSPAACVASVLHEFVSE